MPRVNESNAVTAVAAGATAFAGTRFGLTAMIPALGPVGAPFVLIGLGAALATVFSRGGVTGDALEGVGYGLIVTGVLELGSAAA